jgi:hypothetical protein
LWPIDFEAVAVEELSVEQGVVRRGAS